MHEADKLATAASTPKRDVDKSPPAVGAPGAPSGVPSYDGHSRGSLALSLHAPSLLPPPALPLPPPLPLQSSVPHGMIGAGSGGAGGGDGGQVMVHWTHSGPSVQSTAERAGQQQSLDDDEDLDDDDDELLTPPPPRERLSYTRYQLELLNGIYISVRYPNSVQKQLIAKRVGISREQVKIWFQNRRRKDVVSNKSSTSADDSKSPSSNQEPPSPTSTAPAASPTTHSASKSSNDNSQDGSVDSSEAREGQGDGDQKSRMVPDAVVQGCISELKRFSDEKLKERKEKRKAKGKRRGHAAAATARPANAPLPGVVSNPSQPVGRLFQAYDMVAPPNKVTPTAAAYLNTSANRFNHSHNTSAFSSPRDHLANASTLPRLAWDGLDTGLSQSLSGGVSDQLSHPRAYGGLGMAGLGMGLMSTSQAQSVGVVSGTGSQESSLPVLSDLLSYRQALDGSSSRDVREASLPQSSILSSNSSSREPGKLTDLGSSVHHNGLTLPAPSPFGLNRVYPFPFIADPPIMLSSLHQQDPLRHAPHWPHPHSHPTPPTQSSAHFNPMATMNGMDPYKPVMISSFSNPFFSHPPHPSQWPPQPGGDPPPGTGFPQH